MKQIEIDKKYLKTSGSGAIAVWLENQHDQYVETIKHKLFNGYNFLDGTDEDSRAQTILYIYHITTFLQIRDVKSFDKRVGEILLQDGYVDLFAILNVMNFI